MDKDNIEDVVQFSNAVTFVGDEQNEIFTMLPPSS